MQFATMGLRENFTSFQTLLLEAHVDFADASGARVRSDPSRRWALPMSPQVD